MGQYFVLLNIEKTQQERLGKFGEDYLATGTAKYLCNPDAETSWAGDRLILIGDYAKDIPAGIAEEGETMDMFTYKGTHYSTSPRYPWNCSYSKTSVLRNLCTREYIRADLFPDGSSHPGLGEVILPKIVWSSDPSMAMPTEIDPRGPWAGGRFDIVDVDIVKDDMKWKDITEIEFFNYYTMWFADGRGENCACELCHKYHNEHEDFYENINKRKQFQQPERAHDTIKDGVTPQSGSTPATRAPHISSTSSISTIEVLPAELQENIMVYLSLGGLAACAAASRALSSQATRLLYTSVPLEHENQTKTPLDTIYRRPELTSYLRDIHIVTMAHWESLQVAHELLTQLPVLKSLEFAPCWISYGNLPYWEYPFTLNTLKWGFKQDSAFDRFSQSQPGAHTVLLDPASIIWEEEEGDEDEYEEEEEDKDEEESGEHRWS